MPAAQPAQSSHVVGLIPVITLVLWTGCLLVGTLGFTLPYARPHPKTPSVAPVIWGKITVELDHGPPQPATPSPAPRNRLSSPPLAPRLTVAPPSPALASPLPVSKLVQAVDASLAGAKAQTASSTQNPPALPLVLGEGEGHQTAPIYPPAAIRLGQEGTVSLHIKVDAEGRVTNVDISSASPWPLLNSAALRTVREHWHFAPGVARTYSVSFPFILNK